MTSIVELDGVWFGYRKQSPVLMDAHQHFSAGQIHAVTGPSGCGKSTLLYTLGLMLRPQQGHVRLLGHDYARDPDAVRARARARHVGFVFQDALLDPSMTVWENIAEGLPWHRSHRKYKQTCEEGLERVGLAHLRSRRAAHLSGGQAQRVAVVRALAKMPVVVLADEPTGNLDPASAALVLSELARYGRDADHACVLVTHDDRVSQQCDTVTRLEEQS